MGTIFGWVAGWFGLGPWRGEATWGARPASCPRCGADLVAVNPEGGGPPLLLDAGGPRWHFVHVCLDGAF